VKNALEVLFFQIVQDVLLASTIWKVLMTALTVMGDVLHA
jgi:hypothetical protein